MIALLLLLQDPWIEKLGDPRIEVREEATRELRKIGKPALPALRRALLSKDPEIANRAAKLVDDIDWPDFGQEADGLALAIKAKPFYAVKDAILLRARIRSKDAIRLDLRDTESHVITLVRGPSRLHLCFLRREPAPDREIAIEAGTEIEFEFSPRAWCAYEDHSECEPLEVGAGAHAFAIEVQKARSNEVRFEVFDPDALIAKLEDDEIEVRDRAARELRRIGKAALPALRRTGKHLPLIDDIDWPEPGETSNGLSLAIKAKPTYAEKDAILLRARLRNVSGEKMRITGADIEDSESENFLLDFDASRGLHLCFRRREPAPDLAKEFTLEPGQEIEFTFSPRAWCALLSHSKCNCVACGKGEHTVALTVNLPGRKVRSNVVTFTVTS